MPKVPQYRALEKTQPGTTFSRGAKPALYTPWLAWVKEHAIPPESCSASAQHAYMKALAFEVLTLILPLREWP